MTTSEIDLLRQRLRNQKLDQTDLRDPAAVVAWLGTVQAQDLFGGEVGGRHARERQHRRRRRAGL